MSKTDLGSAQRLNELVALLAATVDSRVDGNPERSYTARLLQSGPIRCGKKIAEEGAEVALAIAAQGRKEVASETADLIFHLLVGLRAKGVSLDMVADALAERRGVSGLAEKASRTPKD
ncbi:phosphoribosyl-ATP diphosphatase [Henriciella marina]|uniref:phosphoribosyl-ATP diphosphatase n=1 Tax=Henriciella marina TaxID=453851 RepID=UPI000371983D|nr:phosphoribosyl-ATP diphosphatase [Henriciella marina]